jgi:hypothetical protein
MRQTKLLLLALWLPVMRQEFLLHAGFFLHNQSHGYNSHTQYVVD